MTSLCSITMVVIRQWSSTWLMLRHRWQGTPSPQPVMDGKLAFSRDFTSLKVDSKLVVHLAIMIPIKRLAILRYLRQRITVIMFGPCNVSRLLTNVIILCMYTYIICFVYIYICNRNTKIKFIKCLKYVWFDFCFIQWDVVIVHNLVSLGWDKHK